MNKVAPFKRNSKLHVTLTRNSNIGKDLSIQVQKRRFCKATKQIATIGPACGDESMIERLFLSGADAFRLNFSHGKHSEKAELVKKIRSVEKKYNHAISILADLQGPKLRIGKFRNSQKVLLKEGQDFQLDMHDMDGDESRVTLPHPFILNNLREGDILLVDDGKVKLQVKSINESTTREVTCRVVVGGYLSDNKGINTPTLVLPISPLTEKDRR